MSVNPTLFAEASEIWNLKLLYEDISSAKGRRLTPMEKLHLKGLLCGYSPVEIAEKLNKIPKGVEADLCSTIYRYIKSLVGKGEEKLESWRSVSELLEEAGYKMPLHLGIEDLLTDKTAVNVTNINIEKNSLVFMIRVEVPTSRSNATNENP